MKSGLEKDVSRTQRFVVDAERTIGFMGDTLRVYATPSMVRDIERTCREFLGEFLDEGENSVGARIEVDHLGPTLIGMWVDVTATVAAIDGRRVNYDVEVRDALDVVGKARHVRFVVDLDKQRQRLEAKAEKVKALQRVSPP
jgi:fluoroacetyl-CoA thioesterase